VRAFAHSEGVVVGFHSAELDPAEVGEFEVAYWGCFIVGAAFIGVHFLTNGSAKDRAKELMAELETDLFEVPPRESQASAAPEVAPPDQGRTHSSTNE